MAMMRVLTRDVTQRECPWLERDMTVGETVWTYSGLTYGAVSPTGIPVTANPDETPFFELPADALR